MNPYKEDGPRARLSFDRAYCKRCTGAPSVNDGYIRGSGRPKSIPAHAIRPAGRPVTPGRGNAPPRAAAARAPPAQPAPRLRAPHRETLSPRLKLSFGSAATGPL